MKSHSLDQAYFASDNQVETFASNILGQPLQEQNQADKPKMRGEEDKEGNGNGQ